MTKNPALKAGASALAAAVLGVGVAACGGSTAKGVVTAPGQGATVASVTSTATSTTTTGTTTIDTSTPKTGALSKEPKIALPKGPPPKKLVIKDLIKGHGATAKKGDQVAVDYVGELYSNGKVFDASWKDNPGHTLTPFTLGAGAVIPGWDKGLVGMKVGGRRELIIPPSLAYGAKGSPQGGIPKNATLVFVVDLIGVSK